MAKKKQITLITLKPINDSSVNRLRKLNEQFEVTKERYIQMQLSLGIIFDKYFEIVEIK
jgi:hypothetical protein